MALGAHDATPEQEKAIGQLMVDLWGSNFQTGRESNGALVLWSKPGPRIPARRYIITREGEVGVD